MLATADIIPNALVSSPDPAVVVQKKMKNLDVECIVRGYLWGSMAAAYEKGDRNFCGLKLPEGLVRFQKLAEPIFTPTTKAETGHDENMTFSEVAAQIGSDMANRVRDISFKLFARGQKLMAERGLILLDTKYEFGLDENGELHVIDEVNTPDSSRMCGVEEYASKWPLIEAAVAQTPGTPVGELLKRLPALKIKEFSKQYVRDALLEMGFDPANHKCAPALSEEQVTECAYRYISIYETILQKPFPFVLFASHVSPPKRLVANLQAARLLAPGVVFVFAGSNSDAPHIKKITDAVKGYGLPVGVRICSAHKQPGKLEAALEL